MTKKTPDKQLSVRDCLTLSAFALSQDAILGRDNDLTLVRLCDQINVMTGSESPFRPQLFLCIEFWRNKQIANNVLDELEIECKIVLQNPKGAEVDVCNIPRVKTDKWLFTRSLIELTGRVGFAGFGDYFFVLYGKTKNTNYEVLAKRPLPVIEFIPTNQEEE